jgi:hypothetical protein
MIKGIPFTRTARSVFNYLRLRAWLALLVLAPLGARAQSGFLNQPVGAATCDCNCGDQFYTVTVQMSDLFNTWVLNYIPDTNSIYYLPANNQSVNVLPVASGSQGPPVNGVYDYNITASIPTSSAYSGLSWFTVYWGSVVTDAGEAEGDGGETISDNFQVSIYPPAPNPYLAPASQTNCPGSAVTLIATALPKNTGFSTAC